jgi:hypothetical protein
VSAVPSAVACMRMSKKRAKKAWKAHSCSTPASSLSNRGSSSSSRYSKPCELILGRRGSVGEKADGPVNEDGGKASGG